MIRGGPSSPVPHDSAEGHVLGTAEYIDDKPLPVDALHAYLGLSTVARGKVLSADYSKVLEYPGVVGILTADDIPGIQDLSPVGAGDEPIFPEHVTFHGQPIFAVVAVDRETARQAARLAVIEYETDAPVVNVDDATEMVTPPLRLSRGDSEAALAGAERRLTGEMRIGGQDHFYLEGHIALALPGEGGCMTVWSSTQHPSEVQAMVAAVLGVQSAAVTVQVRRMGGGFGGKETQGNLFAVVAALAARRFGKPVKIRPDRDDDMIATGKRHDFRVSYDVGFDETGQIQAVEMTYSARCGNSADLSGPVTDRALFHADNCYYYPNVTLSSRPMRTNTVSATAFRGFGGPQGMVGGERVIEEIAYDLGLDPLEVRRRNFYRVGFDVTPYHQTVQDNIIKRVVDELEEKCGYQNRRAEVLNRNKSGDHIRRGISLVPVKFGISFTATWYNQAGALVHVYRDGSVLLNHGGTEMGQGLNQKVAQVVADVFQIDLDRVQVSATATDKVPNTSATAASSGSDLNGMAAADAAQKIVDRLKAFGAQKFGVPEDNVRFDDSKVLVGDRVFSFAEFADLAYHHRVQLSSTGFYKTPDIHWDRAAGKGRPFYYYAYGAACTEVEVDTHTGEYKPLRTDILHDVGRSLNPAIDLGQVEGGFVQGLGWLTSEELVWSDEGRLLTHAPATYKIPLASDLPEVFNVELVDWSENAERTIKRSKAVGEPPFMLAISVLEALSMAVASVADYRICPRLNTPATPEVVLNAIDRLRQ